MTKDRPKFKYDGSPFDDRAYEAALKDHIKLLNKYIDELENELDTLKLKLEKQQELCSFKHSVLMEKALDIACEYISYATDSDRVEWKEKIIKEAQNENSNY